MAIPIALRLSSSLICVPLLLLALSEQWPNGDKSKLGKFVLEAAARMGDEEKEFEEGGRRSDEIPKEDVPTDRTNALAELRRLKATVVTGNGQPDGPVLRIDLSGEEVTNKTLACIKAFPDLKQLTLGSTAVTDVGLAELKPLKKLRWLGLFFDRQSTSGLVTDKGLAHVATLKTLEELFLCDVEITAKGIESCIKQLPGLKHLYVSRTALTSSWLSALADCDRLSELDLALMPVGDSGLAALQHVKHLTSLHLVTMSISEQGISAVGALKNLRRLNLSHTNVDDRALNKLAGLTKLEELNLDNTRITGRGLTSLKSMTAMRELDLSETEVGDMELKSLLALKGLKNLSLDRTGIGDAGLAHLKGLKKLEVLGLVATPITDAGVAELKQMTSLRILRLHETKVSAEKIEELEQAIPALRVVKFN